MFPRAKLNVSKISTNNKTGISYYKAVGLSSTEEYMY